MTREPNLLAALIPVVEAFDRLGVAYQVGGSVAISVHGMARATMDIDLVADLEAGHVDDLVSDLEPEYYTDAGMIREALRERGSFNLIHHQSMLKVDVFLPKDRPYDREALGGVSRRGTRVLCCHPGRRRPRQARMVRSRRACLGAPVERRAGCSPGTGRRDRCGLPEALGGRVGSARAPESGAG